MDLAAAAAKPNRTSSSPTKAMMMKQTSTASMIDLHVQYDADFPIRRRLEVLQQQYTAAKNAAAGLGADGAEVDKGASGKQQEDESITNPNSDPPEVLRSKRLVLLLMCFLKILTSFDSGAFSASLGMEGGISDELRLTASDDGLLGSVVFLGNTLGCAIAGLVFERHKAVSVLTGSMILHALSTLLFSAAYSLEICLFARFLIGVSLAFVVVYSVVWVDTFAPKDRQTTWMAMMNIGVPVGILSGFVVAGAVLPALNLPWRYAFLVKGLVMMPIILFLRTLEGTYINEPATQRPQTATPASPGSAPRGAVSLDRIITVARHFLRNQTFMLLTLGLTVLYFVVTALQVFMTPYLRAPPFNASMHEIVLGFGICAITAPVFGVITGGKIMDSRGGYKADVAKSTKFIAQMSTLGAVFSLIVIFTTSTASFLACLWLSLFAGGGVLPAATGLLMAVVKHEDRPAASSFANITFNVLGYFLGPLFCGLIADRLHSFAAGIDVTLVVPCLGTFLFWWAHRAARRAVANGTLPIPDDNSQTDDSASGEQPEQQEGDQPAEVLVLDTANAEILIAALQQQQQQVSPYAAGPGVGSVNTTPRQQRVNLFLEGEGGGGDQNNGESNNKPSSSSTLPPPTMLLSANDDRISPLPPPGTL